MRRVLLATLVAVALVACGGGDDDAGPGDPTTTTTGTPDADEPAVPGLELLEAEPIEGDDLRPLLSWADVDGAARYSVLVFGEDGTAYWAWEGTATQVHLGGGTDEPLPDDAEGPTAEHATTWFVVAHDGDGEPIASSAELTFG